jgi:uncharacterized protein YjiS (DUF1127 family)
MTKNIATALRASSSLFLHRSSAQQQRRATLKQLGSSMNDQMLEDIGITRDAVVAELGYNPRPSRKLMRISTM